MTKRDFEQRLRSAQQASVSHALLKAGRLVDELGIARVRARWGAPLLRSHTRLFPHIDLAAGTRATELARRVGISKQAASVLVDELVEMGVLERRPDPADGRAWLVHFAEQPGRNVLDGMAVLAGVDADLEQQLGPTAMRELRRRLGQALEALETLASEDAEPD